ncbi:MAG: hypothetical protein A2020_06660 [Lentisphaerae bacterium GWF2_45_14]|nr:MAG: hypothetical protein A2020_06660 [Lentisphaerae bacterium GWF2_45_14]
MIKVLKKAFMILEYVGDNRKSPPFLGDIAKKAALPQPTCSRIVKDLVELEYLEQSAPKKGFRLGPKAYMLGADFGYRNDLKELANPLVKKCSEKIQESVLLAVINSGKRYILCHHNGNPELQIVIDKPYYEDIYATATGRLLLAYSGEKAIAKYVKEYGLPGEKWENINSESTLLARLKDIRDKGVEVDTTQQLAIMAFPIFQKKNMIAALGSSVPKMNFIGEKAEKILASVGKSAEAISLILK